ncbi:DUF3592 domain-containing protein [Tahibacter amnicola]|uniref:DUF3592 domain-containing protein n=1 Tax=Tahibacter amnicola TaxID=2976241 RepID=A0ABY6B999_9GAMM|nr:DUF3592 domain-containing protein [Tahibacter amnicola]UXI66449.1 DUF3592 domain-containing protein [Tahibacter amnicola]
MMMAWIFLLAGAAMLCIGLALMARTRRFLRRAERATATVTGTTTASVMPAEPSTCSTLRFRAADGTEHACESRIGVPGGAYAEGRQVAVLYDPQDPANAVVDSWIELHLPWLIFTLVGTGQLLAAMAVLVLA